MYLLSLVPTVFPGCDVGPLLSIIELNKGAFHLSRDIICAIGERRWGLRHRNYGVLRVFVRVTMLPMSVNLFGLEVAPGFSVPLVQILREN